jgi:hypothetical protein
VLAVSLSDLSRLLHDAVFRDGTMSLCARAYDRRDVSRFWRAWCAVFGDRHCRESWLWHCQNAAPPEWLGRETVALGSSNLRTWENRDQTANMALKNSALLTNHQ